jgi:hypothetical protein
MQAANSDLAGRLVGGTQRISERTLRRAQTFPAFHARLSCAASLARHETHHMGSKYDHAVLTAWAHIRIPFRQTAQDKRAQKGGRGGGERMGDSSA